MKIDMTKSVGRWISAQESRKKKIANAPMEEPRPRIRSFKPNRHIIRRIGSNTNHIPPYRVLVIVHRTQASVSF